MTGTEYIMLIRTTKLALSTDIFFAYTKWHYHQSSYAELEVGNLYIKICQTKIKEVKIESMIGNLGLLHLLQKYAYVYLSPI